MGKKFILNADDFGLSKAHNKAVLEGFNNGFLTSASLCANGAAFDAAVNDILPECQGIGLGVHLNIIEGKALTDCPLLTDSYGNFNAGYLYFILNSGKEEFLKQVENEFRAQIEKIRQFAVIDHIDSHVHTHAIPGIFKITAKLAKEYNIPYIRTQCEKIYFVPQVKKYINLKYPLNIIKILLLNYFTNINRNTVKEYGLKTNDFILGVGFTGMMDSDTVEYGLKELEDDCIAEALIHPCSSINSHSKEFLITQDKKLEDRINRLQFEVTNYKKLV